MGNYNYLPILDPTADNYGYTLPRGPKRRMTILVTLPGVDLKPFQESVPDMSTCRVAREDHEFYAECSEHDLWLLYTLQETGNYPQTLGEQLQRAKNLYRRGLL